MKNQQKRSKPFVQEGGLPKKGTIDAPLVQKLASELECSSDVTFWGVEQKGGAQHQLSGETYAEDPRYGATRPACLTEQHSKARCEKKGIHLDGQRKTINKASETPFVDNEKADGGMNKKHLDRVVE